MNLIKIFFLIFLVFVISLSFASAAEALCWNCEAGTYESADGQGYCECDQDERCKDPFTKSTAYVGGVNVCLMSCSYNYKTDYCISTYVLREYYIDCYCCDEIFYNDIDCRDYGTYECSNGRCVYNPCAGVVCNDYCGSGDIRYYNGYCSGGNCYYSSSYDCDNYDEYFCASGNVRKFRDGYCSGGSCYTSDSTVEDCDDRDTSWTYYCEGDCVKRKKQDYYCSGGYCVYNWVYETVSCNGDSDYCDKKDYYCSGCSHGQYDCDWNSECASGLVCMGSVLCATFECGCCYSWEYWNVDTNKCVECVSDSHCSSDYCTSWSYTCTDTQVKRERTCYDYYCTTSGTCSYTTSSETELISQNGDSDYCDKREAHCTTACSHGQYDCDSNSECASSLVCMGSVLCATFECGCCYSSEYWNVDTNKCVDCIEDSHCTSDYCTDWTAICTDTQVKRERTCYDYYCTSSGTCSYTTTSETEIWNNGHADYCDKRESYCSTACSHGQYDCDSDSECASGLECMGPPLILADGCCYSYEDWAWAENECCDTSGSNPYCSSLTNDVLEQFGEVDSEGHCQHGSRVRDNCAADEVCSEGECHDAIYYTTHFEIHYSVEGDDAPSLTDDNSFEDASDYSNPTVQQRAPDYIEELAQYLETGWDRYTDSYFNFVIDRPTTKIYVEDCWGIIPECDAAGWTNVLTKNIHLDNHLSDAELKTTAVHEFFHVIQILYVNPIEALWTAITSNWLIEGTATWAEDAIFDTADDYLWLTSSLLLDPDQTLTSGSGPYKGYKSVLYWKYFEKYGTQYDTDPNDDYDPDGADIMRELWESIKMNASFINGIDEVDEILQAHGHSWRQSFRDWLIANYAKDLDDDGVGWYDYEEGNNMSSLGAEDGIFFWIDTSKEWLNEHVNKWASDYYFAFCNKSYVTDFEIIFDGENSKDITFILLYVKDLDGGDGSDNLIIEESSLGSSNYFSTTKYIENYERIVAIVAGMSDDADYDLSINGWCGDRDDDGYSMEMCGGEDCNDGNYSINPGAPELCDFIDNNCNDVIDEGCVMECSDTSDCGTDGWAGNPFCQSDDVWQNYRTWACYFPGTYDSYCDYSDSPQQKEDCGVDSCDPWGSNYCKSGDVYHSKSCYDRGCSSGACFDNTWTDEQLVEDCTYTCQDGVCIQLNGDVNLDCKVDIFDLAAVGIAYGSQPGDANWNPNADLNSDGKIDIFDLATVGINYWKSC